MISELLGACYTDAGGKLNEDAMLLQVHEIDDKNIVLGCIADGVGGCGNGDLASQYLIEQIGEWFAEKKDDLCRCDKQEITMMMYDQVMMSHEGLKKINQLKGMSAGSTLTMLLLYQGSYIILHVGDSRAYLYSDGHCVQITKDQTAGQRERDIGIEKVDKEKDRILLQAMGIGSIKPQVYEGKLPESYHILLCSDGLSNKLQMADFSILTERGSCKEKLTRLTRLSRNREERDNISSILIEKRMKEKKNA